MEENVTEVNPAKIMQIGLGFCSSKALLTAVKLELFTYLASGEVSGEEIKNKLGLQERGFYDFLDTLVSLGFLKRRGLKENSMYSNNEDTDLFLDKNKPSYIGSGLEIFNDHAYAGWNDLDEALKTGKPQGFMKNGEETFFENFYSSKEKILEFAKGMAGLQMGNFITFSQKFDFSNYKTLTDIGGGGGYFSAQIVSNNDHMKCVSFDLP